jgi:hypothetical protein
LLPKAHLSISQIKLFNTCERKYYHSYIEGLGKITPYLVAGSACHLALELNYQKKIETGKDMDVSEVIEIFEKEFKRNMHTIDDWCRRDEDTFLAMGRAHLAAHMKHLAPEINPVATEREIRLDFGGVSVLGYVDLEESDCILDHKFKFSANDPLKNYDPEKDLQLTLYAFATDSHKVKFNLHWFKEVSTESGKTLWPVAKQFPATREKHHFDILKNEVVSTAERISECMTTGNFSKLPERGQECYWCDFKELCWGSRNQIRTDEEIQDTTNKYITDQEKKKDLILLDEMLSDYDINDGNKTSLPF